MQRFEELNFYKLDCLNYKMFLLIGKIREKYLLWSKIKFGQNLSFLLELLKKSVPQQ